MFKLTHGDVSWTCKMSVNHQVMDSLTDSSSSDEDLVKDVVAKLKKQGQLSGETAGQIFSAASNQSSTAERQKVTAHIDSILCPLSQDILQIEI